MGVARVVYGRFELARSLPATILVSVFIQFVNLGSGVVLAPGDGGPGTLSFDNAFLGTATVLSLNSGGTYRMPGVARGIRVRGRAADWSRDRTRD